MEKTARFITSTVKKLSTPEEDDEEAAYDRGDDLVRPRPGVFEARQVVVDTLET